MIPTEKYWRTYPNLEPQYKPPRKFGKNARMITAILIAFIIVIILLVL